MGWRMTTIRRRYTAFIGTRMLASGSPQEVALAIKRRTARGAVRQPLIFDNASGRQIDLDLRGTEDEILERYEERSTQTMAPRGRPRLGVVAREVTLLPRHWDWLDSQPGGASVALRRLVDQARHAAPEADQLRQAREATYRFLTAVAGNLPRYEEALRSLFAGDGARFDALVRDWPSDVNFFAMILSQDAFEEGRPSSPAPVPARRN
jgi:hypothetical protein